MSKHEIILKLAIIAQVRDDGFHKTADAMMFFLASAEPNFLGILLQP